MYKLMLMLLFVLSGCATIEMDTCKETCGLHGVKVYNHDAGICECANMGVKFSNSFNNRNAMPSDLQETGLTK
jgi:hypothetical protein